MRFIFLLILISCSPSEKKRVTDEYVLVEFASKLEEDYEKNGGAVLKKQD